MESGESKEGKVDSDDVIAVKIEEAGGGSDEVLEKESGSSDFVCVKIESGTENERSRGRQGVIL